MLPRHGPSEPVGGHVHPAWGGLHAHTDARGNRTLTFGSSRCLERGLAGTVRVVLAQTNSSFFNVDAKKGRPQPDVPTITCKNRVSACRRSTRPLWFLISSLFSVHRNQLLSYRLGPIQAAIESFEIALDTDPSDSSLAGQVKLWHCQNAFHIPCLPLSRGSDVAQSSPPDYA